MIFADFCSLRMASSNIICSPRVANLIVMALENEDRRGKVEADRGNSR